MVQGGALRTLEIQSSASAVLEGWYPYHPEQCGNGQKGDCESCGCGGKGHKPGNGNACNWSAAMMPCDVPGMQCTANTGCTLCAGDRCVFKRPSAEPCGDDNDCMSNQCNTDWYGGTCAPWGRIWDICAARHFPFHGDKFCNQSAACAWQHMHMANNMWSCYPSPNIPRDCLAIPNWWCVGHDQNINFAECTNPDNKTLSTRPTVPGWTCSDGTKTGFQPCPGFTEWPEYKWPKGQCTFLLQCADKRDENKTCRLQVQSAGAKQLLSQEEQFGICKCITTAVPLQTHCWCSK